MIVIISAIVLGLRHRRLWLAGLGAVCFLLEISIGFNLWPMTDSLRQYTDVISYVSLILLVGYLVLTVFCTLRFRKDGKIPKTPLIFAGIAAILRISYFVFTRYLHSLLAEPSFDYNKFESLANIGQAMICLMLFACCCILLYFVFRCWKESKKDKPC